MIFTPGSASSIVNSFYRTFTLLFQDGGGGLELKDPATSKFLKAKPQDSAFVINIGDMLQRFTNGKCLSQLLEKVNNSRSCV